METVQYLPYTKRDFKALKTTKIKSKRSKRIYEITGFKDGLFICDKNVMFDAEFILENFTFLDGSPCGIEINI